MLLGLLDMSAAFDCVEHSLLLGRLEKNFGLTKVVLRWLKSSLSTGPKKSSTMVDRPPLNACITEFHKVQSSARCCSFFTLWTSISWLLYAVSSYISTPTTVRCTSTLLSTRLQRLSRCVTDMACWLRMSGSRLRLNPKKTVLIWLGLRQQVEKIGDHEVPILSSSIKTVDTVRVLGFLLVSHLTMSEHVDQLSI